MAGPITGSPALQIAQINTFIDKKVQPIIQKHKFLGVLKKKGKVVYDCHSQEMEWIVNYRDRDITWQEPRDVQEAPQVNRYKKATLPWRSFYIGESMTKFDQLANRGPEARAKILDDAIDSMLRSMSLGLGEACFIDGNAAGNEKKLHGIESCLGAGAEVANGVYNPSDQYAGLYTELGYYCGDADTHPVGSDPEACFWSPLLLDPTSSSWGGTAATWAYNWRKVIDFAHMHQDVLQNGGIPQVWFMDVTSLSQCKDYLEGKEQVNVNRGTEPLVASLGYRTINYEGIELVAEKDIAAGTAYGIDFDKMSLRSMQKQLFVKKESKDDTNDTKSWTFDCYVNLQIDSPAHLVKVYNFSG
jgi:hypothetical protein